MNLFLFLIAYISYLIIPNYTILLLISFYSFTLFYSSILTSYPLIYHPFMFSFFLSSTHEFLRLLIFILSSTHDSINFYPINFYPIVHTHTHTHTYPSSQILNIKYLILILNIRY